MCQVKNQVKRKNRCLPCTFLHQENKLCLGVSSDPALNEVRVTVRCRQRFVVWASLLRSANLLNPGLHRTACLWAAGKYPGGHRHPQGGPLRSLPLPKTESHLCQRTEGRVSNTAFHSNSKTNTSSTLAVLSVSLSSRIFIASFFFFKLSKTQHMERRQLVILLLS